MITRYLAPQIYADLKKKMVFVAGPRQVGKTTFAKQFLEKEQGYLNWDIPEDRERLLRRVFDDAPLWVFDEIHKYKQWRNYLKGLYDKFKDKKGAEFLSEHPKIFLQHMFTLKKTFSADFIKVVWIIILIIGISGTFVPYILMNI